MELVRFPSRGGFSVRGILAFVLTVILTALLCTAAFGTASYAVNGDATATWQSDSVILFDHHGYNKTTGLTDPTNTIPSGANIYQSPLQNSGQSSVAQKVFIIYFSPGVDPPTATSAKYVEFDYKSGTISNPQQKLDIAIDPANSRGKSGSSCSVTGVGWIICPASEFLADAMDNMFNILASMIAVQPPVLGDSNNSMYIAWNMMRSVANIVFVIVFLIIIYAQLTSLGISNYGLKKLIPRLIITAILVNLSYYIAALAIDVSNIMGYSVQQIFNSIREQTFHLTNDNVNGVNTNTWGAVAAAVLAGGGVVGGVYYMAGGGLYLLLPVLLGLLLTIMFVVIILAARQAIMIILVIIAPLAFVANLLPNTEKYYDKYKDLGLTMLIFFPGFSFVFGGSQLAGQVIIQNAGGNIVMLIFGMAVQIAPLVITPLLLKLSGGLLGRIAQITNNPRKGVIDRNRNWAQNRAEHARQQNMARGARWYNPTSYGSKMVRGMDNRRRSLSDNTDIWKQDATTRYETTRKYQNINERKAISDENKNRVHSQHAAHLDTLRTRTGHTLNLASVEAENAKVAAEQASSQSSAMLSAYRAGTYDVPVNSRLEALQKNMARNVIETTAWKQNEEASRYAQQRNFSTSVQQNRNMFDTPEYHTTRVGNATTLLDVAQGYGTAEARETGRDRASATAVATLGKLNRDARENVITLIQSEAVEQKKSIPAYVYSLFNQADTQNSPLSRTRLEAALETAATEGLVGIFESARASEFIDQDLVDSVIARHVSEMKSKGGFHLQSDPNLSLQRYIERFNNGEFTGDPSITSEADVRAKFNKDLNLARLMTLSNTNADNLGGIKYGTFKSLTDDLTSIGPSTSLLSALDVDASGNLKPDQKLMLERISRSLRDGLNDPSTRASMTDRVEFARQMEEEIRVRFFPQKRPLQLSEEERAEAGGGTRPASMNQNQNLPTPDGDDPSGTPAEVNES